MCTDGGTSTNLRAKESPQSIAMTNQLKRQSVDGTPTQVDACTYQIMIPEHAYSSGKLIVRFNDVQKVQAFINGGPDPHNASEALVEGNATV